MAVWFTIGDMTVQPDGSLAGTVIKATLTYDPATDPVGTEEVKRFVRVEVEDPNWPDFVEIEALLLAIQASGEPHPKVVYPFSVPEPE